MSFAFLFSAQLVPISVLEVLSLDHLVKEGLSLAAVTVVFRTFADEQSVEALTAQLRRGEMEDRLMEFFPVNKRNAEFFARHFQAEGLEEVRLKNDYI